METRKQHRWTGVCLTLTLLSIGLTWFTIYADLRSWWRIEEKNSDGAILNLMTVVVGQFMLFIMNFTINVILLGTAVWLRRTDMKMWFVAVVCLLAGLAVLPFENVVESHFMHKHAYVDGG